MAEQQVVDLPPARLHGDVRVEQSGGADDLFSNIVAALEFKIRRRRRHKHDLPDPVEKLVLFLRGGCPARRAAGNRSR